MEDPQCSGWDIGCGLCGSQNCTQAGFLSETPILNKHLSFDVTSSKGPCLAPGRPWIQSSCCSMNAHWSGVLPHSSRSTRTGPVYVRVTAVPTCFAHTSVTGTRQACTLHTRHTPGSCSQAVAPVLLTTTPDVHTTATPSYLGTLTCREGKSPAQDYATRRLTKESSPSASESRT